MRFPNIISLISNFSQTYPINHFRVLGCSFPVLDVPVNNCYKICYQGHLPIYDPFHERLKCIPTPCRDLATLVLGKHCIFAKEEKTGFCPAGTETPALTQGSWTTEGAPSDRKAKWFVNLWLVSLNNRVFIPHPHFWWRIIAYYLLTKP